MLVYKSLDKIISQQWLHTSYFLSETALYVSAFNVIVHKISEVHQNTVFLDVSSVILASFVSITDGYVKCNSINVESSVLGMWFDLLHNLNNCYINGHPECATIPVPFSEISNLHSYITTIPNYCSSVNFTVLPHYDHKNWKEFCFFI